MISFKALNEISANDESSFSVFHEVRQEEQEAEALLLYNEGLKLSKEGEDQKAEEKLLDVLNTELISQCEDTLGEDEELSTKPSLFLKYNVLKTLATAYEKRNECEKALQYFLQAGLVDESDVTLWWKIATISRKLLNLRLERYAYEKILLYSPHHLPSINGLVSVLYVIGDYNACLHLINKLFEINSQLVKGHAFRDQIFKEEPHLKHEYLRKFEFISTENETENKDLHQKIVQEALILRENRNLLSCKAEEVCLEKFTKPLLYYTWLNLGECILDLNTTLMNRTNFRTLSYRVDLQRYQKTPDQQESLNLPSPVETQKKKSKTKDGHSLKRKQLAINSATGPQPKRRSTRVRYSKRVELDVNWAELIFSYFPEPYKSEEMLTPATMSDCSQATSSNSSQQTDVVAMETDKQTSPKITPTRRDEVVAVSNFINSKLENSGCIDIISSYMFAVAEYFENREWPETLNSVFVELYKKFKNHALQPESAITASDEEKRKLAKLLLLALELQFEQIINREDVIVSPVKGNGKEDEQTRHFLSTFHFLSTLGGECNQLSNEFLIRFYWLHGQYCLLMNQVHCAVNAFNNCCFYLEKNDLSEVSVPHNLSLINEASIQRKLESVKQSQSLDEIQRLFGANRYEEVINVLQFLMEDKEDELFLSDRPSQYHLLQKAYQSTNQHEKSVECCNAALAEILCQQLDQYKSVIGEMLNSLNSSVSLLTKPLDHLQRQTLIESLTKIIEIIMESETTDKWSVATEPWIILHKLIKMNPLDASDQKESSNPFLQTAHVYLGKKHVCCNNQGDFLFYCINEFKQQLLTTSSNKEKEILRNDIEQCLFCLFGDPCKKTKSKIFQEHMPKPIELTWSNALLLYEFYIPSEEANFDLRANTITQEVQNVFRKVFATIPTKEIEVINSEDVHSYIERSIVQLPTLKKPQITNPMPMLCYSLADFYFKNKEFTKAIRFYVNDIAWNGSQRFQSWAAMALARGSRLEEKINMYDFKSEAVIKKHITSTLRCFEKAVSVQDSKCVLFEEYGQIAYTLHSFSSRRLKENMHTPLENKPDTMDYYTSLRARTLPLTFDCMTRALRLTSEREGEMWMHMYLQGKVREKIQRSPDHYLNFYHESLNELYKSGANLEKKIPYHGAQKYSIECIEVFYRIYASILKELKYAEEIDYIVLLKHLDRVLNQKIYVEAQPITVKTSHKETKSEESNTEETVEEAVKSTLDRLLAQFEQQCEKSINENVMEVGGEEKYILLPSGNETRESIFEETDIQEEPKKQNSICDSDSDYESIVKETLEGIVCKACRRETDRGLIGRTVIDRSCDPPEERILYRKIAEKCIEGLEFCMRKFPEHYKSQYALAHFLYVDDTFKDWHRSRDLLLGACGACHLPFRGLFCTRKKTNLFQYIWRIPVNEVDRAGSFLAHIAQMVGLLLLVLHATRNTPLLLHVVAFLHKTPDKDRKYLHDNQRSHLASQAIRLLLDALNSKLQKKKANSTLLNECLEAFKMCQKLQKQQYQKMAEVCLRMCYAMLYPEKGHVDTKTIIEDIGKT